MNQRIVVASLTLSAAAFIGIVTSEGYTDDAIIPTKGDKPTLGFGSTVHESGKPVHIGESTTPVRALIKAQDHIGKEEVIFRKSLEGAKLHQAEYDVYLDFSYQYGTGTWVASSMRREILAGNYPAACNALLRYKMSGGFDCSTPGNRICAGVWTRQLERHKKCLEAQ